MSLILSMPPMRSSSWYGLSMMSKNAFVVCFVPLNTSGNIHSGDADEETLSSRFEIRRDKGLVPEVLGHVKDLEPVDERFEVPRDPHRHDRCGEDQAVKCHKLRIDRDHIIIQDAGVMILTIINFLAALEYLS